MFRPLVFGTLLVASFTCTAQSGTAVRIQCTPPFELPQKQTLTVLSRIDPKAAVSFDVTEVKVRFSHPLGKAEVLAFKQEAGLAQCHTHPLELANGGGGPAATTEGTIGSGADQRRTVMTER